MIGDTEYCVTCGKEFVRRSNAIYCSTACRNAAYNKRASMEQGLEMARKGMPTRKYRKPKMGIIEVAAKARNCGMSYGQYVARFMGDE